MHTIYNEMILTGALWKIIPFFIASLILAVPSAKGSPLAVGAFGLLVLSAAAASL